MKVRMPKRRRESNLSLLLSLIPLLLAVVAGCSSRHLNNPPEHIVAKPWTNVGEAVPSRDGDVDTVAGLSQVLAGKPPAHAPGRPLNVLVMSGGGKYGAFTAGALAGWTKNGSRPTFDIATGISSGAVVATFSFLGPKYDKELSESFTTLRRSDLFRWQPIRGLITGTGLMSSEPLQRKLEREVNDEFM
ncbi:MAG TPA: patatin-like phospholipase family protein, partial [Gemmata sp.]|nr:patatin-like phospholipase family protein [Gemmata sp.]